MESVLLKAANKSFNLLEFSAMEISSIASGCGRNTVSIFSAHFRVQLAAGIADSKDNGRGQHREIGRFLIYAATLF